MAMAVQRGRERQWISRGCWPVRSGTCAHGANNGASLVSSLESGDSHVTLTGPFYGGLSKMLAVVVADVEVEGEYQFERRKFGATPDRLHLLAQ